MIFFFGSPQLRKFRTRNLGNLQFVAEHFPIEKVAQMAKFIIRVAING